MLKSTSRYQASSQKLVKSIGEFPCSVSDIGKDPVECNDLVDKNEKQKENLYIRITENGNWSQQTTFPGVIV
ncbi:hypothetical protein BTVI_92886 [Pitangus sulphuratus]|nr:hypothetical protein BTVI_92886 [Pitangus sulphuratus]